MNMSAMEDAAALCPWAEPNEFAINIRGVDEAVRRALSEPVPPELAMGVPLLRFATEGVPPMPLLEAMLEDPLPRHGSQSCDRCGNSTRSITERLWIPSGASVVVLALCWSCRVCAFDSHGKPSTFVWS